MELEWTEVEEVNPLWAVTQERVAVKTKGYASGVFVIHHPTFLLPDDEDVKRYVLTHIPSGTAYPVTFPDVKSAKMAVEALYKRLPVDDPRWQLTTEQVVNMHDEWDAFKELIRPTAQAINQWLYGYEESKSGFQILAKRNGRTYKAPRHTRYGTLNPLTTPA